MLTGDSNILGAKTIDLKVSKIDCLRFVMCPLLVPVLMGLFSFLFDAAVNSTNEANKAGGTCH